MTNQEFQKFRDECEQWIRSGQFARAQKSLSAIKTKEVRPGNLRDLCNLYRRAHLWKHSLMALRSRVRPKPGSSKAKATAGEKIEYALALQRAGAYRESRLILDESEVQEVPQSLVARAFHDIFHWDYESAAPLLEQFLKINSADPYENLIVRVNLLACRGYTNSSLFATELDSLKQDLRGPQNPLLLGLVFEITAQHLVVQGHWSEAEATLREAEQLLKGEGDMHLMFVEKWRKIALALKSKSVKPLDEFRLVALNFKHWETLRDLDYFRAVLEPESSLTEWVYFGTPFASFRKRLEKLRDFPEQAIISRSAHPIQAVDPWYVGNQHGDLTQLLFVLLLRDLYRPAKIGHIFSELFWDGFLNVNSMQDRVHQLIRRLRTWIGKNGLPFKIVEVDGAYSLRVKHDAGLVSRKRSLPLQKLPFIFGRYGGAPSAALSSREWADRLNVTPVKARNLLVEAVSLNLLTKQGDGPSTRYKLKS